MKKIENFCWELDQNRILKIIGSPREGPIFDRLITLYEYFSRTIDELINPLGIYHFTPSSSVFGLEKEKYPQVVLSFLTLGEEVDGTINRYFTDGKYLEALLLDIMTNEILFMCTDQLYTQAAIESQKNGWGLTPRLEPGNDNLPLELQKEILANLDLEGLNVSLTENNMLTPLKSLTFFCGAGPNIIQLETKAHVCEKCSKMDCVFRHE